MPITAQDSVKELKDFIHAELKEFRAELRGEMKASQADLLIKLFGIIFGCSSLVVAVLKLIL